MIPLRPAQTDNGDQQRKKGQRRNGVQESADSDGPLEDLIVARCPDADDERQHETRCRSKWPSYTMLR